MGLKDKIIKKTDKFLIKKLGETKDASADVHAPHTEVKWSEDDKGPLFYPQPSQPPPTIDESPDHHIEMLADAQQDYFDSQTAFYNSLDDGWDDGEDEI